MHRKVYIAGPISSGPLSVNVGVACAAAKQLLHKGYAVYVPHLFTILDCQKITHDNEDEFRVVGKKETSIPYGKLLNQDLAWIQTCDALYVCSHRESVGTRVEIEFAVKHKIPVFDCIDTLHKHFQEKK